MDEGPLTLTSGVIKTILDAIITTLPIPLVLRTEMRRRQRFMVAGLFALGYVVTGAGIARVYYTYKAFFTNGDMTWWQYPTFVTSTIENNIAIVRIQDGFYRLMQLTGTGLCVCTHYPPIISTLVRT